MARSSRVEQRRRVASISTPPRDLNHFGGDVGVGFGAAVALVGAAAAATMCRR